MKRKWPDAGVGNIEKLSLILRILPTNLEGYFSVLLYSSSMSHTMILVLVLGRQSKTT